MRMNAVYQAALNGTLVSTGGEWCDWVGFVNHTDLPLSVSWIDFSGLRTGPTDKGSVPGAPGYYLSARGGSVDSIGTATNNYWLVTSPYSGAFAAVVSFQESNQTIAITPELFLEPGDIGQVPQPNSDVVIPGNSPRVLVGSGRLPVGNAIGREQYWQRMPDSYTLAPQETRTVSYTVTSGVTSTSSKQDTVESSVGVSAGAGWGPVSAHMSSNLSNSSTTYQSVTVSSQTTSFNSNVYENPTDDPMMLLVWQLTDEITVFNDAGQPMSSVSLGTQPVIVSGPYNPNQLGSRPELPEPTGELRRPTSAPGLRRGDR